MEFVARPKSVLLKIPPLMYATLGKQNVRRMKDMESINEVPKKWIYPCTYTLLKNHTHLVSIIRWKWYIYPQMISKKTRTWQQVMIMRQVLNHGNAFGSFSFELGKGTMNMDGVQNFQRWWNQRLEHPKRNEFRIKLSEQTDDDLKKIVLVITGNKKRTKSKSSAL